MKKIISFIILFSITFGIAGALKYKQSKPSLAADIYDMFTEEHLLFYENEIVNEKVYSNKNQKEITKLALELNVSADKVKKLLVYQDAAARGGKDFSLKQINNMNPVELIKNINPFIEWLKSQKSEEELEELKRKFSELNSDNKFFDWL